jgi:hypothetical protein
LREPPDFDRLVFVKRGEQCLKRSAHQRRPVLTQADQHNRPCGQSVLGQKLPVSEHSYITPIDVAPRQQTAGDGRRLA